MDTNEPVYPRLLIQRLYPWQVKRGDVMVMPGARAYLIDRIEPLKHKTYMIHFDDGLHYTVVKEHRELLVVRLMLHEREVDLHA